MSLDPKQDNARPMGFTARTLVFPLLLGMAVVAIPDMAPAGIFDFLKRDRDGDVEIIETHGSNCRCRPRCSHPKQARNQHTTPQTAYRPTPQPTPQTTARPTPQTTLPYAPPATTPPIASQKFLPAPVFQSAPPAPPTPPVAATLPTTRSPARYAMRPTPGVAYPSTPIRPTGPTVIYQREMVVKRVPITTWQTQWVDRGSYRMVWVSRPALQQVPRTTYRPMLGYRVVPYQRMAVTTPGVPVPGATAAGQQPTRRQVSNPLEARPVTSRRSVPSKMKPTTAHRVWQARGRLGR